MLEGGSKVSADELFNRERSIALQRGTLIHAFFEQIEWLDDGLPDPEVLEQAASNLREIQVTPAELNQQIDEFFDMLERP